MQQWLLGLSIDFDGSFQKDETVKLLQKHKNSIREKNFFYYSSSFPFNNDELWFAWPKPNRWKLND